MANERHSIDAIKTISDIVEEKGVLHLGYHDSDAIAYEAGYVLGRLLRKLGIRTGAVLSGEKPPQNRASKVPSPQDQTREVQS